MEAETSDRQGLSFDAIADPYDRYRPHYPEALFDALLELAELSPGSPGAQALELGCGSGIATLPMARRGLSLLCLEPGPRLAALAREKLEPFPDCRLIETTFEAWTPGSERFDLVYCAQAFHWLDPETRFERTAGVLRPRGSLAIFGNISTVPDASLRAALDRAYDRFAPALSGPSATSWYGRDGLVPELVRESGLFEPVEVWSREWLKRYVTEDYVALLGTYSGHSRLPERERGLLFDEIARAIVSHGGQIEVGYETVLFVSRKSAGD